MAERTQRFWHKLFELGVVLKGFNGVWETVTGFMVLFVSEAKFTRLFSILARHELLEDPNDWLMRTFASVLQNLSHDTKLFAAIYILAHGFLNLFLAIQLYRDRHWAYLVMIWATAAAMTYQIYRIALYHSPVLAAVTMFDACFIILAWHEYKHHRDIAKGGRGAILGSI